MTEIKKHMKKNNKIPKKIPYWKENGFNSKKEYDEWYDEIMDDIRHGYC